MTDRVASGSRRLDEVLGGGLPANAINLIIGQPGSGKTVLAQQYMFQNAEESRPGVYLSTVSEPLEKILRYGQALAFFDAAAIGRRIFYEDIGGVGGKDGLAGVLDRLKAIVRERQPAVLAIDSFKALGAYATTDAEFRRFLHELAGMLTAFPVTALWIGEYAEDDITTHPEFAVADSILLLDSRDVHERAARALKILKLRGSSFSSGRHAYRISSAGIDVFPRLADVRDHADYELGDHRISSGIDALDFMLADGYWPGASTLIAGPTGVGKTLMGLHFAFHGARNGEPGVIATLQEDPSQLERIVRGFGWSLADEGIHVLYRSPVDLYVDEWVYELLDTVDRTGARRVVVDSLGDLQAGSTDLSRFREYAYSLLQRCSRRAVSLLMTYEIPELFGLTRLSEFGASHLADNVVVLQYLHAGSSIERTLVVLKTRASGHDHSAKVRHHPRRDSHRRRRLPRPGTRPHAMRRRSASERAVVEEARFLAGDAVSPAAGRRGEPTHRRARFGPPSHGHRAARRGAARGRGPTCSAGARTGKRSPSRPLRPRARRRRPGGSPPRLPTCPWRDRRPRAACREAPATR
jgi:circadian clock protein KaiC